MQLPGGSRYGTGVTDTHCNTTTGKTALVLPLTSCSKLNFSVFSLSLSACSGAVGGSVDGGGCSSDEDPKIKEDTRQRLVQHDSW